MWIFLNQFPDLINKTVAPQKTEMREFRADSKDDRSLSPFRPKREERQFRQGVFGKQTVESLVKVPRLCSLREYLEIVEPYSTDEDKIIQNYKRYKDLYLRVQRRLFFDTHKSEEWFIEKYHPDVKAEQWKESTLLVESRHEIFFMAYLDGRLAGFSLDADESETQYRSALETVQLLCPDKPTLIIKSIHPTIKRSQIWRLASSLDGFEELVLGEPSPYRKFSRTGWIVFNKNSSSLVEQLNALQGVTVGGHELQYSLYRPTKDFGIKSSNEYNQRIRIDLKMARHLVRRLDKSRGLENKNLLLDSKTNENDEEKEMRLELDMLILYLRTVHSMCYYCGIFTESFLEMTRECGILHARHNSPLDPDKAKAEINRHDVLLNQWIGRKTEPEDDGQLEKLVEEELVDKHVILIEEDDPKSKCASCSKLFKGTEYVIKHLYLKHEDIVSKVRSDSRMLQVFDSCDDWDKYIMEQKLPISNHQSGYALKEENSPNQHRRRNDESRRGHRREHYVQREKFSEPFRKLKSYNDLDSNVNGLHDIDYGYDLKGQSGL